MIAPHNKKGFTLIETLVAISVLLVVIVGPLTLASDGLVSAYHARDQIMAYHLAQEAIELIRMERDNVALEGVGAWLSNIGASCLAQAETTPGCGIEMRRVNQTNFFIDCAIPNACVLNYDTGAMNGAGKRGMYTLQTPNGSITKTKYTRQLWVEEMTANREAFVTVKVSWFSSFFNQDRSVVLRTSLFNIYE